jgi:hypothetical protein
MAQAASHAPKGAHAATAGAHNAPAHGGEGGARAASGPGFMLVVTGPSGAGKGTLVSHLLKTRPSCVFSVSATTRCVAAVSPMAASTSSWSLRSS